jgi:hypothetical protein
MRMHLSQFLAAHPPDTDLKLASWQSDGEAQVRCVLRASPWWLDPARRGGVDGLLAIECRGVVESELRIGWRQSEVEELEVLDDHPLLWAHGEHASIYGNAPLPDPDRFFVQLADVLEQSTSGSRPVTPLLGATVVDWRRRVTTNGPFLLLTAPARVVDACLPFLDAQQAGYSVVRYARAETTGALKLVVIGESWLVCREASVEVEPPPLGE